MGVGEAGGESNKARSTGVWVRVWVLGQVLGPGSGLLKLGFEP